MARALFRPSEVLFGRDPRLAVVRTLRHRAVPLTGREVARETALYPQQAHQAIAELASCGVLRVERTRAAVLCRLNEENLIAKKIYLPLLDALTEIRARMKQWCRKALGPGTESALLFGSVARGRARERSDADVIAIVRNAAEKERIEQRNVTETFQRKFGIPLEVIYLSVAELRSLARGRNPLVEALRKDAELISGKPLEEILRGQEDRTHVR